MTDYDPLRYPVGPFHPVTTLTTSERQALIDEFTNNPDCKVFLSTDAGGTGLNLQAADSVVNFELPWNPARLNQRIGRVNRIGQKSRCVNVVNLISKNSIEEKILAGIQLKTDLFEGVFARAGLATDVEVVEEGPVGDSGITQPVSYPDSYSIYAANGSTNRGLTVAPESTWAGAPMLTTPTSR